MSKQSTYAENLNISPPIFYQNPTKLTSPPSLNSTNQKHTLPRCLNNQLNKGLESSHEFLDSTTVTHSSLITDPLRQNPHEMKCVIQHLVLENFKLKACPFNVQHNHKSCPFYHNNKDKKRPGNFYSADICEFAEREESCPNGDLCQKSHNRVEQLYRPDKYKTKFCSFYPNHLEKCEYDVFCSFAHNENDILVELIHNLVYDDDFFMFKYKTVWCPFNLTQHDKSLCVYAHNWQDYRRSPHLYHYEASPCPNWKSNDFVINYNEGCSNNFACLKCHGWKEYEFHPLNYKIKQCPAGKNCTKGRDCSYYHNEIDRRVISQEIAYNVFKYFPKNRIITNTYKTLMNEYNITNLGNEYSTEIALANVNNPWEKRDPELNDRIHSLTDANLLNLYDNVNNMSAERRENFEFDNAKIKPSFSMTNFERFGMQNSQKMKNTDDYSNRQSRQEIIYPNETWSQKKPSQLSQPKSMMAFSQPLFENKQDLYPNQFMSGFEEPEFQNNQPLTQTPSINPNNMKRAAMNFAMTPPPNLQKINPMQRTPVQNQKPSLNNTPNVMNQINQMRIPSKNPNMQMRINQAQMSYNETKMKNVKSANFSVNMYDPQAQIQMNFPSNQPNNQNMNHPLPQKMSFSPQNCVYFNNNVNFSSNENISKMESPDDQQKVMSMKLSMNSINQNKNKNQPININPSKESKDKPQFNLNINSQPFAVSYSFNCTPNMANSKTQSVEADISEKIQNKLGFWTNSESNSMQKTTSQVNLNRNFGSYDLDSEKQIRSENQSPLMQSKEDFNATVLKLDNELAKKLNLERENENHSEAQINNILKNICEEDYEDKV